MWMDDIHSHHLWNDSGPLQTPTKVMVSTMVSQYQTREPNHPYRTFEVFMFALRKVVLEEEVLVGLTGCDSSTRPGP